MPETTLREDLESAIEQFESEALGSPAEPETPAEDAPEPSEPAAEEAAAPTEEASATSEAKEDEEPKPRRRDERGRFLADDAHPTDAEQYPNLTTERVNAAPEGWRPAAREGWGDLPENVRREIHRRELDIAVGMQQSAQARDHLERFTSVVTPFSQMMAAEGLDDPLRAVEQLMGTAAALHGGSPQQKAQRIAGLIQHYGIDLEVLDGVLAAQIQGQPAPGGAPPAVDPALDARLKPLETFVQDLSTRLQDSEKARAQTVEQEIEAFRENAEFLEDVRLDMADLLDMAANRNRAMSLQEAYDTACSTNPEVRRVLDTRKQQTVVQQTAEHAAAKRELASSSLTSKPAGTEAPPPTNGSLREDLARAWDQVVEERR